MAAAAAQIFRPILDDIYDLSTSAPTPMDVTHSRRLAPEAVVSLDWHNEMSKLILDRSTRRRPRTRRHYREFAARPRRATLS
jgi:metallo-beta-lactamase family protein